MLKSRGTVSLARLRGIGSLPDVLEAEAGERGLIKAFQIAELPLEVLQNRDTPIPIELMSSLFEAGTRVLGERSFGLIIGQRMSYKVYRQWAEYCARAPDLGEGLRRACSTIWSQMSGTEMTLTWEDGCWVWRCTPPLARERSMQYVDHIIFPMMKFAQYYLGKHWRPDWVEVSYPRDQAAQLIETALQAHLRCSGKGIAFPFSPEELTQPHPAAISLVSKEPLLKEVTADLVLSNAKEPARSFSAVVSLRLLAGESDIEGAAALAGVGVQGLQRRLRVAGYTYREIVETARRERALTLLKDTNVSISEIAFSLGYEEHANFSRAFQRWMGCSPSAYRDRQRLTNGTKMTSTDFQLG